MKRNLAVFLFALALFFPAHQAWARWTWSPQEGKFVNVEGQVQDEAEEIYQYALQFYKEKDNKEAIDQLKNVVEKYPSSRVAPDAQYRIGVIYEETGDYKKAFHAYKKLLTTYPQNRNYDEVVERLYKIGNAFLSGKKARLLGLEILPSTPRAIEVFKFLVEQAPFSAYGDKAAFQLGLSYKKAGKFEEALQAFQGLIDQHSKSDLVPDARYQLAETSYLRSKVEYRDERALGQASEEVQKYIDQFPESGTSEEANKLKQAIDEKNAEKNYRIGLYYEKDNYLQSALIYYTDAAERYPQTQWGQKAVEKLNALKEPAAYHTRKEKQISEELQILRAKRTVTPETDAADLGRIDRKIELLEKREKNLEKTKKESLSRLKGDLKRRDAEMRDKWKKFKKKQKTAGAKPTEELKSALDRWEKSLREEQDALDKEKKQLQAWREDLGVKERSFSLSMLPFIGDEVSDLDEVRSIEAKKLYKISMERKRLLDEKEILYKQRSEILARVEQVESGTSSVIPEDWMKSLDLSNQAVRQKSEELKALQVQIQEMDERLQTKEREYDRQSGQRGVGNLYHTALETAQSSGSVVVKSIDKSFDVLNPFGGDETLEEKSLQELLERRMHLREKLQSQQTLVESLAQAKQSQSALQEQQQLMKEMENSDQKKADTDDLRRRTKEAQKKVRALYQEIEDLDKSKQKMLEEIQTLKRQHEDRTSASRAGNAVTRPLIGTAKLMKAFVVGLPNREVEITQSAESLPSTGEGSSRARDLQQQIEMQSVLIEAKSREIVQAKKQLEMLRAQGALESGIKFRSVFVDVPYEFIGEAIENARKVVPRKDREKFLTEKIDEETPKLESLKKELKELDSLISAKGTAEAAVVAPAPVVAQAPATLPDLKPLREEIESLRKELSASKELYSQKKGELRDVLQGADQQSDAVKKMESSKDQNVSSMKKETESLRNELRDLEKDLRDMIERETRIEGEETRILQKRISAIEKRIPELASTAAAQDLLREKESIQGRISELELRRDFLSKEIERFAAPQTGKKA